MRDGAGVIGNVRDVFQNINEARVRGIDYELLFNAEPNFAANQSESLTFRFLAGRLLEESTTLLGGPVPDYRDIAGRWYEPDLKLLASVRYSIGAWGVNLQQRYMPETRLDGGANPVQAAGVDGPNWVQWEPGMTVGTLPTGAFTIDDNTVQSKSFTDVVLVVRRRDAQRSHVGSVAGGHEPARRGSAGDRVVRHAVQLAADDGEQLRHLRSTLSRQLPLSVLAPCSAGLRPRRAHPFHRPQRVTARAARSR